MAQLQQLKSSTINGVIWGTLSRVYSLGVQFAITIVLSRLLAPEDFGTIGALSVFSMVCQILVDSGFSQALIRESNPSSADYSSVFFFNLIVSSCLYLLLFVLSPNIESFFQISQLSKISRLVFLQLVIHSLSIVPSAVLSRELQYKKLSIVGVVAISFSAVAGISAAFLGLGVYAIVIQLLVQSVVYSLLIWVVSKWKLYFVFSIDSIKRLFRFSFYLLLSGLIITFFNNLYTILIGRFYSQTQLGYYTQAKKLEEVPNLSITTMIQNVSYSAMSKVKDDLVLLKSAYKKVIGMNLFVVVPIMLFCFVSADSLIPFLFGTKWLPSIPYFKILCIYGAIFPLQSINGNILKILGLGRRYLLQECVRRLLMILFIFLTIRHGIEQMLWGWTISLLLSILFSFIICGKPISYPLYKQILDQLPLYCIVMVSSIIPYCMPLFLNFSYFPMVLMQLLLFFVCFISLSRVFKLQAFLDVYDFVMGKIQNIIPQKKI